MEQRADSDRRLRHGQYRRLPPRAVPDRHVHDLLPVVLPLSWLTMPRPRALAAVHHRRQLRLLRLVGLALRLPARRLHASGTRCSRVAIHRAPRRRHGARRCSSLARRRQPRPCSATSSTTTSSSRRSHNLLSAIGLDVPLELRSIVAAGRDLVLHVPGDQLRRRHLPRRLRAGDAREVRRLPLVLPASRRRADRAAERVPPAARQPRDPRRVDTSRAFCLIVAACSRRS